mmetsp:Transcript_23000/g.52148  ORF Transcript_23000/g.52148 Transcript_23000/m.52148 type:complete len:203 (+) Transcript_23000:447-1055(+)
MAMRMHATALALLVLSSNFLPFASFVHTRRRRRKPGGLERLLSRLLTHSTPATHTPRFRDRPHCHDCNVPVRVQTNQPNNTELTKIGVLWHNCGPSVASLRNLSPNFSAAAASAAAWWWLAWMRRDQRNPASCQQKGWMGGIASPPQWILRRIVSSASDCTSCRRMRCRLRFGVRCGIRCGRSRRCCWSGWPSVDWTQAVAN